MEQITRVDWMKNPLFDPEKHLPSGKIKQYLVNEVESFEALTDGVRTNPTDGEKELNTSLKVYWDNMFLKLINYELKSRGILV
jgi:hypothetical protein